MSTNKIQKKRELITKQRRKKEKMKTIGYQYKKKNTNTHTHSHTTCTYHDVVKLLFFLLTY